MSAHTPQTGIDSRLQELIATRLEGADLLELIPIPRRGDKMVRMRTLEEAIDEIDGSSGGDVASYLVQIRVRGSDAASTDVDGRSDLPPPPLTSSDDRPSLDGVYLPTGQLNTPYLIQNAELLLGAGDAQLAKNIYKSLLQSGEKAAEAHFGLARCAEAEGALDDAETHAEESLAYRSSPEVLNFLVTSLLRRKRYLRAGEALEKGLMSSKSLGIETRFRWHRQAAQIWAAAGKPVQARSHYAQAIELRPTDDGCIAEAGEHELKAGDLAQARKLFQDALAANPRCARALTGIARCAIASGNTREAHDSLARSLREDLLQPEAVALLIRCAHELKSYATAARIAADYCESGPVNLGMLYSLAGLFFQLGKTEEAVATAERILSVQPNHSGARELVERLVGAQPAQGAFN